MDNFPAPGHLYQAVFANGLIVVDLDFNSDGKQMTFRDAGSTMPGMKPFETVNYTAIQVRPQVYLVYWQEIDKMTLVHLEDFERGLIHTHITSPAADFYQFSGTLKQVR
jgi:hypothetical protein